MWPIKLITKIILAKLPIPNHVWRKFQIFRHGDMDSVDYAASVFNAHAAKAFPNGLPEKFTILELGCGDSLLTALLAAGRGAKKIYLVDHGVFARQDVDFYKSSAQTLTTKNIAVPDISSAQNMNDVLNICAAEYMTGGLASLKQIPSDSVDFIFSHAVLEHVWRDDFTVIMREFARILKRAGAMSHTIDYQDHFDNALNHLRFSDAVWESHLFKTSGFYTNRILYKDMMDMVRQTGFDVIEHHINTWHILPTQKTFLSAKYRGRNDNDLRVKSADVVMHPKKQN